MTVEMISQLISTKVKDQAGIELATCYSMGYAARHIGFESVVI